MALLKCLITNVVPLFSMESVFVPLYLQDASDPASASFGHMPARPFPGLSGCIWQFSPRYKAEPSATPMLFNASLDKIRKCGAKVLFFCMQRCFTPMKTGCRGFSPCFRARMGEVSRRPFMRIGFSALCPVSRSSCKPGRRPGSAIRKDPMPARCLHSRGTTAAAGTRGPGRCSL